jgi:threonine dehydratase
MGVPVSAQDVRAAASVIEGRVLRTPCLHSRTLSEITGATVILKFENLQFTASFKERGVLVKLESMGESERAGGVIAMSAGNHAQAVALHAQRLGISAVIVMPRHTPQNKVTNTERFGAEVLLHGEDLSEAGDRAEEMARERGLLLIHPYDDPRIIAGQGTVALEMLEAFPDLDDLVVPVGGGGLLAGSAIAARDLRPEIRVFGVETERYPSMRQALAGEPIECGTSTLAEGIAVKRPGLITREIVREKVERMLLVDESTIELALLLLLDVEKTVVEGAGAVGVAALLRHRELFAGRRVGIILSGGNIDLFPLSRILQRGLVRAGELVRLRVALEDRPGTLAAVTAAISRADASIVEVHHQRNFTLLPLEAVDVELVLRTRGRQHLDRVIAALEAGGFRPRLAEADRSILASSGN